MVECGAAEKDIRDANINTCLLHDLHVVGDSVYEAFERLHLRHGVDLSSLDVSMYFPSEISRDAFLISFYPDTPWGQRAMARYPRLSLRMVSEAVKQGRWPSSPVR